MNAFRFVTLSATVWGLLNLPLVASAQPSEPHGTEATAESPPGCGGGPVERCRAVLDLIRYQQDRRRTFLQRRAEQLQVAHQQLRRLYECGMAAAADVKESLLSAELAEEELRTWLQFDLYLADFQRHMRWGVIHVGAANDTTAPAPLGFQPVITAEVLAAEQSWREAETARAALDPHDTPEAELDEAARRCASARAWLELQRALHTEPVETDSLPYGPGPAGDSPSAVAWLNHRTPSREATWSVSVQRPELDIPLDVRRDVFRYAVSMLEVSRFAELTDRRVRCQLLQARLERVATELTWDGGLDDADAQVRVLAAEHEAELLVDRAHRAAERTERVRTELLDALNAVAAVATVGGESPRISGSQAAANLTARSSPNGAPRGAGIPDLPATTSYGRSALWFDPIYVHDYLLAEVRSRQQLVQFEKTRDILRLRYDQLDDLELLADAGEVSMAEIESLRLQIQQHRLERELLADAHRRTHCYLELLRALTAYELPPSRFCLGSEPVWRYPEQWVEVCSDLDGLEAALAAQRWAVDQVLAHREGREEVDLRSPACATEHSQWKRWQCRQRELTKAWNAAASLTLQRHAELKRRVWLIGELVRDVHTVAVESKSPPVSLAGPQR